jgi:hypothetical protein
MPGTLGEFLGLALLTWLVVHAVLFAAYWRELRRLWREPVLRYPLLIIESDDWGAGPLQQAAALKDIAQVLAAHRDSTGRAPVLNLALVLAVPDGPAIGAQGTYVRVELDHPMFADVLSALRGGQSRGVFALQLHGMEHYWPPTLMASRDAAAAAWLRLPVPATTERLPSHLQSRWVDAGSLPSSALAAAQVREAVADEVRAFERIFAMAPRVVVPPTFVWTRQVEQAWAELGLECIVTPGWRYTCRGADGLPGGDEGPIACGDRCGAIIYLARSDYFEPSRGRDSKHAMRCLARAAAEGRACVLENHRDNFIQDPQQANHSLVELDKLCGEALARHERLRFVSSWELSCLLRQRDPNWLVLGIRERLPYLWVRLSHTGRLWKLLTATGIAPLGRLVFPSATHQTT